MHKYGVRECWRDMSVEDFRPSVKEFRLLELSPDQTAGSRRDDIETLLDVC